MIRRFLAVAVLTLGLVTLYSGMQQANAQGMDVQPGTSGYDFTLTDLDGNSHTLSDYFADGKVVVLEWFNPGCPFVKKYYEGGNPSMLDAKAFAVENDVVWLMVNSGAPGKQGHGIEHNQGFVEKWGIDTPLLIDESGIAGRMFGAQNTPQLFILSSDGVLLYNGGVDETVMAGEEPQNNYVINALTQYMAGKDIDPAVTAHVGCSVKYGEQEPAMQPSTAKGGTARD